MDIKKQLSAFPFKSTALYGASSVASFAAIVHVNNDVKNFSSAGGGSQTWDIDQDATNDVTMGAASGPTAFGDSLAFNLIGTQNLDAFVRRTNTGSTRDVRNLTDGFVVGATLAANYGFGHTNAVLGRLYGNSANYSFKGFTETVEGKAGFRFKIGGQDHYGWAAITIDHQNGGNNLITISEWAYEDTAGSSIQVGAVPEPTESVVALGLLAAGAAGLRRLRRQRSTAVQA